MDILLLSSSSSSDSIFQTKIKSRTPDSSRSRRRSNTPSTSSSTKKTNTPNTTNNIHTGKKLKKKRKRLNRLTDGGGATNSISNHNNNNNNDDDIEVVEVDVHKGDEGDTTGDIDSTDGATIKIGACDVEDYIWNPSFRPMAR